MLNEPETSLHPDLLAALAQLVVSAAAKTQVIAVSHAREFIAAVTAAADVLGTETSAVELVKPHGETEVDGQGPFDAPPWQWPKR